MKRNKRSIKLIKLYQKNKRVSGRCHFIPSCSNYAIEAYSKFNWFYASFLTAWRIIRCTPFTPRKYDPVPLTKKEKKQKHLLLNIKKEHDALYIDLVLKQTSIYPHMTSDDYYLLTLEYLFGYNYYSKSKGNHFEQIGTKYVRTTNTDATENNLVDKNILDKYLNVLCLLNDYQIINYEKKTFTEPSDNYIHDYMVIPTANLSLNFWLNKIKNFCSSEKLIIGIENINQNDLDFLAGALDARVLTPNEVLKNKLLDINQSLIIIGDDLSNPKLTYYLHCLIRFYDTEKVDINKYNFIIPKNRVN